MLMNMTKKLRSDTWTFEYTISLCLNVETWHLPICLCDFRYHGWQLGAVCPSTCHRKEWGLPDPLYVDAINHLCPSLLVNARQLLTRQAYLPLASSTLSRARQHSKCLPRMEGSGVQKAAHTVHLPWGTLPWRGGVWCGRHIAHESDSRTSNHCRLGQGMEEMTWPRPKSSVPGQRVVQAESVPRFRWVQTRLSPEIINYLGVGQVRMYVEGMGDAVSAPSPRVAGWRGPAARQAGWLQGTRKTGSAIGQSGALADRVPPESMHV